jgi:hypothetical protein
MILLQVFFCAAHLYSINCAARETCASFCSKILICVTSVNHSHLLEILFLHLGTYLGKNFCLIFEGAAIGIVWLGFGSDGFDSVAAD